MSCAKVALEPRSFKFFCIYSVTRTHCFLFFLRTPSYSDEFLPSHPCLRLVANSEQGLSRHVSRRLITMEKIKENAVRVPCKIHRKEYLYFFKEIHVYVYLRVRVFPCAFSSAEKFAVTHHCRRLDWFPYP